MKKFLIFYLLAATLMSVLQGCLEEDKSKRISPPAIASDTVTSGNIITINYGRPSMKGRTLGRNIATFDTVWRTGANEATTFEITKDAKIQGKALLAGRYSLYTIPGEKTWTIIFNKTSEQWGTEYKEADDVLRVQVTPGKASEFVEMLKFIVERNGTVLLFWGDTMVGFTVD